MIDHSIYFNHVRDTLFSGALAATGWLVATNIVVAQESCVTLESGEEVCVGLTLKPNKPKPPEPPVVPAPPPAGAVLPVDYDLAAFDAEVGTLRFIAPDGNDGAACTEAAPCASLGRAQSAASNGDAVVIRGGIYRGNELYVSKSLFFTAWPGETPEFRGSIDVTDAFHAGKAEGGYRYITYTEQPITNGFGVDLVGGQNVTGGASGVGMLVDQLWIGDAELKQVRSKGELAAGKFWVDAANNRAYLMAADADEDGIEISQTDNFLDVAAKDVTIRGLRISRYSPSGGDYGMIDVNLVDGFHCDNVEMADISTSALFLNGTGTDQVNDATINHCSILRTGWLPFTGSYNFTTIIDGLKSSDNDPFDEFTGSPGSGNKFTHCHYMTVQNSEISNNKSHGLWFDQSCYDAIVANNTITGNQNTGVFWELSDELLMINNYVQSAGSNAAKLGGGSTGIRLINNTLVGGPGVVGVYTDKRSSPGCADVTASPNPSAEWTRCTSLGTLSSDRIPAALWHDTIDWLPRIDEMWNNIIAWPSRVDDLCGGLAVALCITDNNSGTSVTPQSIIHVAEPGRDIPATFMDYNVYQTSGPIVGLPSPVDNSTIAHATTASVAAALGAAPYGLAGLEAHSLATAGLVDPDGLPSAALKALQSTARAMPADVELNAYLPAGVQCFGAAWLCGVP